MQERFATSGTSQSVGQAAKAKPHNLRLRKKQVIELEIPMLIDMSADAYVDAADD